ncbi:MAG TPA: RNA-guided endonuclease IscB [Methylomicrobium sp.]|nr:RNA-guided endonuclease IscB [Methylomicrobium sp.]
MCRVLVIDKEKRPLMPCFPVRARQLLSTGQARVYRRYPFTIILRQRSGGELQDVEWKSDPGSKTTGLALVAHCGRGGTVVWAAHLVHRGDNIHNSLVTRRAIRRSRRARKTRYRQPRFDNRVRPVGWLSPSLQSRVDNVAQWVSKLLLLAPIGKMAIETVRFDTQRLCNPEISAVEYQQGELFGYETREYLLAKWGRKCAYCGKQNLPLQIEHIVPVAKGGSDRISNLTLACDKCNKKKGSQDIRKFLAGNHQLLEKIVAQARAPLKDAAAVNTTRYAIAERLKSFGLPLTCWSGGRTKHNRSKQGYRKEHWIDAACVGESGAKVALPKGIKPLLIQAIGRGSRQACRMDKYGFPRTSPNTAKQVHGFQTGDMVKAIVTQGKKVGTYTGYVAIRASGSFNISTKTGVVQGISYRYCQLLQKLDGYSYS